MCDILITIILKQVKNHEVTKVFSMVNKNWFPVQKF